MVQQQKQRAGGRRQLQQAGAAVQGLLVAAALRGVHMQQLWIVNSEGQKLQYIGMAEGYA